MSDCPYQQTCARMGGVCQCSENAREDGDYDDCEPTLLAGFAGFN